MTLSRELRLAPANVHRRHDVIEQVRRDAARVVPVLSETEEPVSVTLSFVRRAGHIFQSIKSSPFPPVRHQRRRPVPFTPFRVAMVRTLASSGSVPASRLRSPSSPYATGRRKWFKNRLAGRASSHQHSIDELFGFIDRVAHGLLEINVLARIHGGQRDRCMPVVRRGDYDCVYIFLGQQFAVIEIPFYAILLRMSVAALRVDIANRGDTAQIVALARFIELAWQRKTRARRRRLHQH